MKNRKGGTQTRSWQDPKDELAGFISIFDDEDPDELLLELLDDSSDQTINDASASEVLGELASSGDINSLDLDADDTLLNSHEVGLRLDEDYDNPQPLNTAADIDAAERSRRGG